MNDFILNVTGAFLTQTDWRISPHTFEDFIALQCKENLIYVFLSRELRGLSPNFQIHVFVSNLYIPRIGPHISLQQNRQTDPGNI
jgi:hypothetical protein